MTIVMGLGNPGARYENTRHNVGFTCVDRLAAFFQVRLRKRCFRLYSRASVSTDSGNKALLVKPLTYMNRSGDVVRYFGKDDKFVVVVDNMDLACGGVRIKFGGGNSGQKGMASIAEALGTPDFLRIYIGTGRPHKDTPVNEHVLGVETLEPYRTALDEALEEAKAAIVEYIDGEPIERIQCRHNRKGIL